MKKFCKFLMIAAVALFGSAVLASCGDDDDDRPNGDHAVKVAGTYNGPLSAKVMNIDCVIEGTYDVVVQKQDEDDVIVVLPACSYSTPNMPRVESIPSLTVRDVDVDREGHDAETYFIEEDDFSVVVDGVTYIGEIHGIVKGSKINLEYSVTPGKMPMPINFTFTGSLK